MVIKTFVENSHIKLRISMVNSIKEREIPQKEKENS